MAATKPPRLNAQVSEEAAGWLVEFRMGNADARSRREFDAWMRASPEHLRAYLEVAAIWNEGHLLGRECKLDDASLAERAALQDNVVCLAQPSRDSTGRRTKAPAYARGYPLAAALFAAVCFLAATAYWQFARPPTYSTGIGEQRSVQLPDGSTVELNAVSRIRIAFDATARTVRLVRGQALFRVAKDSGRPFVVESGSTRVRAVGTEFDVYQKRAGTVVTVLEGRVAVSGTGQRNSKSPHADKTPGAAAPEAAIPAILLSAGEQVTVAPRSVAKPVRTNVAAARAWTQRQLVFESASLQDIAEEVNRYSRKPFVVEDPAPQDLHLSGVFSSTDLDFLVRFLRERSGITVRETEQEIRIVRQR